MSGDRSSELDAFVEEAKTAEILTAFERAGFSLSTLKRAGVGAYAEHVGPCPACGGRDRFAISPAKQKFNCRGAGGGGVLTMLMHISGAAYLDACELALGRDRPNLSEIGRAEREDARRVAQARRDELRAEADAKAAQREAEARIYRAREWERSEGDWSEAGAFPGSAAEAYLAARGVLCDAIDPAYLRCHPRLTYWGKDKRGRTVPLHAGPAMLMLFVVPEEGRYHRIGLHRTWIDLDQAPKFRPEILDPRTGETLATKKMRGSKAGGFLPLIGRLSTSTRLVAGEGIETVLGYALWEGVRADTFYCAAGDLGNLCGRAVRGDRLRVAGAFKLDKNKRRRPVFCAGETPDEDSECLPVPAWISELVLLGDGDSEPVATRAALVRGATRHARDDRLCRGLMAPAGEDWADVWTRTQDEVAA